MSKRSSLTQNRSRAAQDKFLRRLEERAERQALRDEVVGVPWNNLPDPIKQCCRNMASEMQRAFPSDPFIGPRVLSQLKSNPSLLPDFNVEWREEHRSVERVQAPFNVKFPCS